jgi:hypothetical protein
MWVKEIKHAIMDGTIGLILKRVKDENFYTKIRLFTYWVFKKQTGDLFGNGLGIGLSFKRSDEIFLWKSDGVRWSKQTFVFHHRLIARGQL